MSTNPFPFNQTIDSITPLAGDYSGYTFSISASANGIGACEFQPTTGSNPTYNFQCPYDINAFGSNTSAVAFLVNGDNQASTPYYFLIGSQTGGLLLYSLTPSQEASGFSSSNVVLINESVADFRTAVSDISYNPYVPTGQPNLLIAGQNGTLYESTLTFYYDRLVCGGYQLIMQSDGNFVLYNSSAQPLWASNTMGEGAVQALMQTDGNLVLYKQAQPLNQPGNFADSVWSTATNGNPGAYLSLSSNGTLAIISSSGAVLSTLYAGSGSSTSQVKLNSGQQLVPLKPPTYTSNSSKSFSPTSSGQVQIALDYQPTASSGKYTYYVTGLSGGGLLECTSLTSSNFISGAPANTVAIALGTTAIYVATASTLYSWQYGTTTFNQLWTSTTETITSLSFSPLVNAAAGYPNGVLFIGTYETSSGGGSNGTGSIYVYNPSTNANSPQQNPFVLEGDTINGSVYALYSDANGHLLSNDGSTGLNFINLVTTPNLPTQTYSLIPNVPPASSGKFPWSVLVSLSELVFGLATDDPAAIAFGYVGLVADAASE